MEEEMTVKEYEKRYSDREEHYGYSPFSTGMPGIDMSQWDEIGSCMKCGREAILVESRDGDGAHACKFGCKGSTGLEKDKPKIRMG